MSFTDLNLCKYIDFKNAKKFNGEYGQKKPID